MNNNELDWNKSSSDCCEKRGFGFVGLWEGFPLLYDVSIWIKKFIYLFMAWSRWDFLPESFGLGDRAVCSCNLHACSLRNIDRGKWKQLRNTLNSKQFNIYNLYWFLLFLVSSQSLPLKLELSKKILVLIWHGLHLFTNFSQIQLKFASKRDLWKTSYLE